MKTRFQFLITFPEKSEDNHRICVSANTLEIALVDAYKYACEGGNTGKFSLMFEKTFMSAY